MGEQTLSPDPSGAGAAALTKGSTELVSVVAEAIIDGVIVIDERGTAILFHPPAERNSACDAAEVVGSGLGMGRPGHPMRGDSNAI